MLEFKSLVIIPSDHCNISCKHCASQCGPTSNHPWDVQIFKKCIEDASKIPNLTKHVHLAGGEPFLYFPQLFELALHAQKFGFTISVVTNGFWGFNQERSKDQISHLVDAGLTRVELSHDSFHKEFVPIQTIRGAIRILKEAGVHITLRVITTRKHMIDETIRDLSLGLSLEDLDGLSIVGSPVVPVGRALLTVPEEEYYLSTSGTIGACSTLLNLTVRPDGNVSPCCAGSDLNLSLSLGNINNTPLDCIVRNAEWNFLVKQLVYQGIASFFPVLRKVGLGNKIKPLYTNICHACTELFGDPDTVSAIKSYILIMQQESLINFLAELPATEI